MKYAQSTGGFYLEAIHGENIPADAVEISDIRYVELLQGQEAGQQIVADGDGAPVLEWPALVPATRISALQGLKAIDHFGLASAYDAWANDPARTFLERAFINRAQTWERDDATLIAAALALGIGEAELDAMFAWASP